MAKLPSPLTSARMQDREFIDSSPIAVRVDIRDADADEILAFAGYEPAGQWHPKPGCESGRNEGKPRGKWTP